MLPREQRLRRRVDLLAAQRRGRRAGGPLLVVHLLPSVDPAPAVVRPRPPAGLRSALAGSAVPGPTVGGAALAGSVAGSAVAGGLQRVIGPHDARDVAATSAAPRSRAGVVVSRAVGGAVVRNQVKRRLRHLLAPRLGTRCAGCDLVVRARPAAAGASSAALGAELDRALARLLPR